MNSSSAPFESSQSMMTTISLTYQQDAAPSADSDDPQEFLNHECLHSSPCTTIIDYQPLVVSPIHQSFDLGFQDSVCDPTVFELTNAETPQPGYYYQGPPQQLPYPNGYQPLDQHVQFDQQQLPLHHAETTAQDLLYSPPSERLNNVVHETQCFDGMETQVPPYTHGAQVIPYAPHPTPVYNVQPYTGLVVMHPPKVNVEYIELNARYLSMVQKEAAPHLGMTHTTLSKRFKEAAPGRQWPQRKVLAIRRDLEVARMNMMRAGNVPSREALDHIEQLEMELLRLLEPVMIRASTR
ncbi:hypothetical protein SAMD00019534_009850 [Acytostelium subglobosum LB1]|uniref:hypothetical protein n=1 Tax=Acytostelium subglobosum LB1 TaxID=1410327 RepID=UPI000644AF64|nr:hypothetical protein SAMD00019534_009850 [Acytostelium subglobosum LB1]GAM17810.1 hypothetical protein SAMD00019534_009850 [Acytostelium subglobosum LB1]|eukprot:XP_012758406.1 hypothetical protein SAMD00019534_009850 [Acytostelium subglobosum LB1]